MKKFLYLLLATAMLATFGCTGDTNTNAVGVPNPNTLMPTGTVQGILKDVCTNEPIVGAIIDIGVAKATTNERGQYVMKKVPATSYVSPTGERRSGYSGTYSVTIDMRKAESTVTKTKNYPAFSYDEVEVQFSSLEETKAKDIDVDIDGLDDLGQIAGTNNHDTPVVGLGNGDQDFYVGQVTTSISGIAVTKNLKSVPNGYTVKLYSLGSHWNGNTSTGARGHLIYTTKTKTINNIEGRFEFTGLEASQNYKIEVIDTDTDVPTMRGIEYKKTKCEGTTWFGVQDGDPIIVRSTDEMCPFITGVTPTPYSDLDPATAGGITVTINFSEPIAKTPLNSKANEVLASQLDGLYKDIYVMYEGSKASFNKAGNIAHTIKWNDTMTALIINIPVVGKASVYSVSIGADAVNKITDAAGNKLSKEAINYTKDTCEPITPFKDAHVTEPHPLAYNWLVYQVHFTTYGATAAGTPVLSKVGEPYDYNDDIKLSWTETPGAKYYNLYCAVIQNWGATTNVHPYAKVNNAPIYTTTWSYYPVLGASDYTFVENYAIQLTHKCYLVGVDADGLEGPASNEITAADTVAPRISGSNAGTQINAGANNFTVTFREPMVKSEVQTLANWTLNPAAFTGTPVTITGVSYNEVSRVATVQLSGNLVNIQMGSISTGPNGIAQTHRILPDVEVIPFGQGQKATVCVTANAMSYVVPAVVPGVWPAGDDHLMVPAGSSVDTGTPLVDTGDDGICQTTAPASTLQTIAVGNGLANAIEITASVGNRLETAYTGTIGGDDVLGNTPVFVTVTGVHDVAGNLINALWNFVRTDGSFGPLAP